MSDPLRILHGPFGRVVLVRLDRAMALHAHLDCHIVFKLGGPDILFGVGQREHAVTTRNALLINAWEPHFYNHRNGPAHTTLLAMYLRPQWLQLIDRRFAWSTHPRFFPQPVAPIGGKLERLQTDLLDLATQPLTPPSLVVEQVIANIFTEIVSLTRIPASFYPCGARGELGYDARIRKAVERMLLDPLEPVSLLALAKSIGLSRAHFFRLFQRSTGLTPAGFINMRRMEAAILRVSRRESALQDISLELGFDTAGSFTRFFTAQQGVAPSKYRRIVEFIEPGQV